MKIDFFFSSSCFIVSTEKHVKYVCLYLNAWVFRILCIYFNCYDKVQNTNVLFFLGVWTKKNKRATKCKMKQSFRDWTKRLIRSANVWWIVQMEYLENLHLQFSRCETDNNIYIHINRLEPKTTAASEQM